MRDDLRILFVDDEPTDVLVEQYELERAGLVFVSRTAASEASLRRELMEFKPDVVLCDYNIPGFSGLRALEATRELRPSTPILMISGTIAEETAIECLKCGATDYLLKSHLRRLGPAVRRAVADTRQRRELEQQIYKLTNFDTVTGLPNLSHVDNLVRNAIDKANESQLLVALVVLNLDQFRFVDEGLGRKLADEALKGISLSLRIECPRADCVARIGADEFLVVLSEIAEVRHVNGLVKGLLAAVAQPRRFAGQTLELSSTAGIALYPADGANFETLLSNATAALHEAKLTSRRGFQFHSEEATKRTRLRRQLESELHVAIAREELSLCYQPQFDIETGRPCGVEALARWVRPNGDSTAPSVFIPLAEETGAITALGKWALNSGCRTVASWPRTDEPIQVCVNVSAQQINRDFTNTIGQAIERSGLAPDRLELEITESVLVANSDLVLECLTQWKGFGVRIAVDDFGTGYSNLAYLSRLPIDRLKIDRSLVLGIDKNSRETTIVKAVISLGRELGFTVLAEGVETEAQLAMLRKLGCHQAQGYLLCRPIPAAKAREAMMHRWGLRSSVLSTSAA